MAHLLKLSVVLFLVIGCGKIDRPQAARSALPSEQTPLQVEAPNSVTTEPSTEVVTAPEPVVETTSTPTFDFVGKVVRIIDGDTVAVLDGNKSVTIRLHGIDAPEREQDYGSKAKDAIGGKIFREVVGVRKINTDEHGRTVGVVFIEGKDINEWMLANGWAWHFKTYDDSPTYASAETSARDRQVGIWSGVNIIAPWDFRKGIRTPTVNVVRPTPSGPVASSSGSSSSGGTVHVRGYYRKDGTYVRPHTRSKARR